MGLYQKVNKKKRGVCIGWTQEANEGGALRSDMAFIWQLENFESQENDQDKSRYKDPYLQNLWIPTEQTNLFVKNKVENRSG